MKNLTLIIPLNEFNNSIEELLKNMLKSIEKQTTEDAINLLFVFPPKISDQVKGVSVDTEKIFVSYLINNGNTNYQTQVNLAVGEVKTEYFSVLEFDDELSNTYEKNVFEYVNSYPDVDIFMCLIVETNEKNEAIKLTNELVWSQQTITQGGVLGFLNPETLNGYSDFKLSGAPIKTESFKRVGGYKANIELSFMYEFLLRSLQNGLKIMTIPKVIYKHFMNREGSMFDIYLKNLNMEEKKFWFDVAKREYNFNTEREIDLTPIKNIIK